MLEKKKKCYHHSTLTRIWLPTEAEVKLNREGREILDLLKEETTEEAIVSVLAAKYENDRAILADYVRDVLDRLHDAGLLAD